MGKTAILVLGMHRSGTSACTRTISLLGADLPNNLMPPQPGNNEAGFWESMDVYQLNDEILASGGSSWDDWLSFNPDWLLGGAAKTFKARALAILEHDFGNSALFVLKDPRICRLLPFWLEVLRTFEASPKCLITIRNPLEVAASLRTRDGFSPVKSHALWLRHMLDAEYFSRPLLRAFLRYDDLLADWRLAFSRLSGILDLRWPRRSATAEVEIDQFLNGKFRHHSLGNDAVLSHPEIAGWVKDAFQAFLDLDAGNNPEEIGHRLDRIRTEFDVACQMLGPVAKAEEMARLALEATTADRVKAIEAQSAEHIYRIGELEALVAIPDEEQHLLTQTAKLRDNRIAELTALVDEHASDIRSLTETNFQLKGRIGELEALANQNTLLITEYDGLAKQRADRIDALQALLDQGSARIGELKALAEDRAGRINELEALIDQGGARIAVLEALAEQRAGRTHELEPLLNQASARISEVEGQLFRADQRQSDLQSQLFLLHETSKDRTQMFQALLCRLNAIQLSASWQLARPFHALERRWPGVVRGIAAVEKLTWWTATAQLRKQLSLRRQSHALLAQGLFNLGWYIQQNPDVILQGLNPILHWLVAGWQQGRDPNPLFDINWYLQHNPDVRQAKINPLLHYIQTGASLGRLPHPLFDTRWYLEHNPDAANSHLNPLAHYLRSHPSEKRDPHPLFNSAWYLQQHSDVEESGENPLIHFLSWGAAAGRDPNPFFDSSWYMAQYPNVGKQGLNPLVHYVRWGAAEGWNPSPLFDTHWYLDQHPEIAAAHLNPLAHYLHTGIHHGWPSHPAPLPTVNRDILSLTDRDPAVSNFQPKPAANAEELEKVATLLYKQEGLFGDSSHPTRILVIDWKPPTPDRDSGSYRMSRLLFCLRDAGYEVDFIGDRMAEGPQYIEQLVNRHIRALIGRETAISHLAEYGNQYRLALLARPETFERYLPLVRAFAPQAKILYDTVDLHWVRFDRSAATSTQPSEAKSLIDRSNRYKRLELANAESADITLAISEEEKQTLLTHLPNLTVAVLPNLHEIASWRVPFGERRDLFFIGGFDHEPNVDAVIFFVNEIMPLVRQEIPNIKFHIVGSNMPTSIRDLAMKNIIPVGYVEDVEPYFAQCRIFVAPLRHGAGMKGKVGQSLSFGLPVVTTPVGAEGIGMIDEMHALIRSDPADFAQAIVRLYEDEPLWQRLSESGRDLIRQHFSIDAVRSQLLHLVEEA